MFELYKVTLVKYLGSYLEFLSGVVRCMFYSRHSELFPENTRIYYELPSRKRRPRPLLRLYYLTMHAVRALSTRSSKMKWKKLARTVTAWNWRRGDSWRFGGNIFPIFSQFSPSFVSLNWGLQRAAYQREKYSHNPRNLTNKFIKMRVMTITKTTKMNHVTPGTVISAELNKSSKSNSPIIMTPVFTILRPGFPKAGTVFCVREWQVPVITWLTQTKIFKIPWLFPDKNQIFLTI